jgi:hypothetical protein
MPALRSARAAPRACTPDALATDRGQVRNSSNNHRESLTSNRTAALRIVQLVLRACKKAFITLGSPVVPLLSTSKADSGLASEFRRDRAIYTAYERMRKLSRRPRDRNNTARLVKMSNEAGCRRARTHIQRAESEQAGANCRHTGDTERSRAQSDTNTPLGERATSRGASGTRKRVTTVTASECDQAFSIGGIDRS